MQAHTCQCRAKVDDFCARDAGVALCEHKIGRKKSD